MHATYSSSANYYKNPETFLKILGQLLSTVFIVIFLEFISNFNEKFRNITCEIQKLPSKKPETFLKSSESNKKANVREWGFILRSLGWKSITITMVQYSTYFKCGKNIIYLLVVVRVIVLKVFRKFIWSM